MRNEFAKWEIKTSVFSGRKPQAGNCCDGSTSATLSPSNFSLSGLIGSESFTVTQTAGTYNSKDVATATTVTASLAAGDFTASPGTLASNYTLPATASGAGQITPAALTITANDQAKAFGAALPSLTASYSGFVNGDTSASLTTQPTLTTTATASSPVGPYPITASGAVDANYSISYVSGTLTIIPAIILSPTTLPVATVGVPYSQQLRASGGSGAGYSFAATGLPAGLSLTPLGLLSGTPATAMGLPFMVDVTVTDGAGDTGGQIYPLTVQAEAILGNIVSSLAQSYYGEAVTLTATFSATPTGSAPMTGTVAFYDGNTYLGTEPLIAAGAADLRAVSGTSSLSTSSLSVGNHIITAVYSGDARYSAATVETPVSVEVVAAVTSTTLTASTTAQGTTLAAKLVVTSPGNPPIVGTVSFYDGSTLLGTVPVSNGVAILNVGSLSPGSHSFRAVFSGGGTFSGSASSLVASTDGPQVTNVLRYGFHWQPTYLLINFNGPLDPTSAQNPSNYQILGPAGHRITVVSAIYDPATQTVTLVPAGRLNIHWKYRLTVNGTAPSGLTNPSGILLDGAGNGKPGSNYVTSITWRNLAGKASKLPTLVLVHAAPPRPVVTHTPPQHPKAALHTVAVDHLLVTESLHVRGLLRARR